MSRRWSKPLKRFHTRNQRGGWVTYKSTWRYNKKITARTSYLVSEEGLYGKGRYHTWGNKNCSHNFGISHEQCWVLFHATKINIII
jgi:hypothetical protein